jgi:hypothetical protein
VAELRYGPFPHERDARRWFAWMQEAPGIGLAKEEAFAHLERIFEGDKASAHRMATFADECWPVEVQNAMAEGWA